MSRKETLDSIRTPPTPEQLETCKSLKCQLLDPVNKVCTLSQQFGGNDGLRTVKQKINMYSSQIPDDCPKDFDKV